MVQFVSGPNITAGASAFPFTIPLPPDLVMRDVIGIQFSNKAPWNVIIQGFAASTIEVEANTHKYVPNNAPGSIVQGGYIATSVANVMIALRAFSVPQGTVDMHVFFDGDKEPSDPYISVARALRILHLGATDLVPSAAPGMTVSQAFAAASHGTLTLDLLATGGPAFLVQAMFCFAVPTAAVVIDATLQDGNGSLIDTFHLGLGIAPMPPLIKIINYVHPVLGVVNPAGHIRYILDVPATVNGPGYSLSLKGYD